MRCGCFQAVKNIQKAIKNWDGEEAELAQVHNALGYAYYSMERYKDAVKEYQRAVALQPGYYIGERTTLGSGAGSSSRNTMNTLCSTSAPLFNNALLLPPLTHLSTCHHHLAAWNNMGDAYEALKDWSAALDSYKETLALDPENRVAKARAEAMSTRLSRVGA